MRHMSLKRTGEVCFKANANRKSAPLEVLAKWSQESTAGNRRASKDLEGTSGLAVVGWYWGPKQGWVHCLRGCSASGGRGSKRGRQRWSGYFCGRWCFRVGISRVEG
eukprot:3457212-Alexandrium_andersonii.AAC.1